MINKIQSRKRNCKELIRELKRVFECDGKIVFICGIDASSENKNDSKMEITSYLDNVTPEDLKHAVYKFSEHAIKVMDR